MAVKLLIVIFLLSGCNNKPTPFILGEEVEPPYGCIEARRREVDC